MPIKIPNISLYTSAKPLINSDNILSSFIGSLKAASILYNANTTNIFITGTLTIKIVTIKAIMPPAFPISSVAPRTVSRLSDKNFPTTGTTTDTKF